ncbi:glutaredoxin 3 [Ectothiorhodospiraceae bacterium 2226]|nr:glutaredoxin 3 [Ectothiorhodospiraceae bacterium 2226]
MEEVTVYATAACPYCIRARMLLQQKGVLVQEIRVDRDMTMRREMIQRSGGRTSVPQIFIGTLHIGGCDELYALERAGRLDTLLSGDG